MKIHGTAKGAALSTKDFGVAFGSPAAPATYTLIWENTDSGSLDDNQGELYFANEFDTNNDVIGEPITKITVQVLKVGSPTATIQGFVWFGTNPNAPSVTSAETYQPADVGTSLTELSFSFSNETDTVQGYLAGFGFSGLGDGSNHYKYGRKASAVDGTYIGKGNTDTWSYPVSKGVCLTQKVYTSP